MSSPSLTLQCRQCNGVFATPKADFSSLIQCPHCATAAPIIEFSALQESSTDRPEIAQSTSPHPPISSDTSTPASPREEANYHVRGKWLQFDCPHCVRPMRLIAEDAGGLVDCAHCGLELIAPDPTIGRGARLSRASEGRVHSAARTNMRDLRGDQLKHSKENEKPESFESFSDEELAETEELDPNHALSRGTPVTPEERKRAVKALHSKQVGSSFRRKEVLDQQAIQASDTEWDPTATRPSRSFGDGTQDRYGFWIALAVAALILTGIVTMVVREASHSDEALENPNLTAITANQKARAAAFLSSFQAAQHSLAAPTWEALAKHVREPERVTPLMLSYYATESYQPLELSSYHAPIEVTLGNLLLHEMKVTTNTGEVRTIVIETSTSEPKIDWELMVNLPRHNWEKFLDERPTESRNVRVIASRSSVLDRYFEDAGLSREDAIGIRIWHGNADGFFAVIPKNSTLAKSLIDVLEWEKGRKIVVRASFDSNSKINDRVNIEGLIQTGWVIQ